MRYATWLLTVCAALNGWQVARAQTPPATRIEQGALIQDGIAQASPEDAAQLARWLESRSASLLDWLADGSLLISTRFANSAQMHRVRAPLGMREQLTWNDEAILDAWPHPTDANVLLFGRDRGGDENMQLWRRNLATGEERLLTDGKSRYGAPVFAHDGHRIAFAGNARDGANYDIYVSDLDTEAAPRLAIGGGSETLVVQDWSADDRRIAFIRYRSNTDSELVIADLATGMQTRIEPVAAQREAAPARPRSRRDRGRNAQAVTTPATTLVTQARYSPDGRGIWFLSDRGGEFVELRYRDLYTNVEQSLTPDAHWDVERFALSSDGQYVAYTQNEAGIDRLMLYATAQKANVLLPPLPPGAVIQRISFDRGNRQLAVSLETSQSPRDIYVLTLGAPGAAPGVAPAAAASAPTSALPAPTLTRWTQGEVGPIDARRFVAAQLVQFPTWDRTATGPRLLSAFLFKPTTPGPHPVLIDIHGGPESQYRPKWDAFTQYLVNELGYVVIAPNVRGSSGYGRGFLKLDDGKLREDAVRDIGSLLVWIGLQSDLDRSHVAVMGSSYGGYLALSSLAHYGDRLVGAIDSMGITSFVSFLQRTSPWRRDLRRAEYGDERDADMRSFLQGISPVTNAAAIKRPLLIVQGMNDPRVPASESEQMMARVRAAGGEVWYLAAKDEGHSFRRKSNRDAYLQTVAQFLRRLNSK
jgi:dipeptidyl aminopeptidase/acylaminoacyl peptidase